MSYLETMYVMQYPEGDWVGVDSSSGGYPFRVPTIRRAEVWTDKIKALEYRHMFKDEKWTLHTLEMSTIPELITPGEEARASGDKEYAEFLRLAEKFGMKGKGECPFSEAWIGQCKATPDIGEIFCSKHLKEKCFKCKAQATRNCDHTSQFVCGTPMCDLHNHH